MYDFFADPITKLWAIHLLFLFHGICLGVIIGWRFPRPA